MIIASTPAQHEMRFTFCAPKDRQGALGLEIPAMLLACTDEVIE